eukprot:TRINITY_DN34619_c0_g1_i3.p1 TRINITY_DN34619_c0_g1~~TRINITY_DN34619_c0_g1_i3.p1  ORF type:complete len:228 (-),score=40.42 TRINITY_DN34619_c0_g1_i3:31-714(-)
MAAGSTRICTYNIFEGLDSLSDERVTRFRSWIQKQNFDVVALNEANHFTEAELERLGASCGLPFTCLLRAKTGFHLGLMSRSEVEVHDAAALSLHHGLLHGSLALGGEALHLLVTHLTPFECSVRREEVKEILTYVSTLASQRVILLGDLNSLSSNDVDRHHHAKLLESMLSKVPKLRRKFLQEDGSIDYEPLDMLYGAGFVDCGAQFPIVVTWNLVGRPLGLTKTF